jgi:exopolysaccharide production protein ExoQ
MYRVIPNIHRGHILGFSAISLILTAVYASAGTTIILFATLISITIYLYHYPRTWSVPSLFFIVILGLFVIWAMITSLWSIEPLDSVVRSLKVALVFAAGLVLIGATKQVSSEEIRSFRWMLMVAVAVGSLVLLGEVASQMAGLRFLRALTGNALPDPNFLPVFNRAATVLALLVWPVLILCFRHNRLFHGGILFVGAFIVLWQLYSSAAILAVFAGLAIFTLALISRSSARLLLIAGISGVIAFTPVFPRTVLEPDHIMAQAAWLPLSAHHRLRIWAFTSDAIMKRPITGWGMDTARSLSGGKSKVIIKRPPPQKESDVAGRRLASEPPLVGEQLPLHPHNAVLQLWLELGIVGVVLGVFLLVRMIVCALQLSSDKRETAAVLGYIATAFVISYFSYGIWQTWWLSVLWICSAFTIASSNTQVFNKRYP